MDVDPRANIVAFQLNTGADEIVVGRAPTLAEDGVRQAWEGVHREHATSTGSVVALHTEWEPSPTDVAFIEATFPGVPVTFNFPRPTPDGWEEALAAAQATMLDAAREEQPPTGSQQEAGGSGQDASDGQVNADASHQGTGGDQHHTTGTRQGSDGDQSTAASQRNTGDGQAATDSQRDTDGGQGSNGSQQEAGHSQVNTGASQQCTGGDQGTTGSQRDSDAGQGTGSQRDADGSHGTDSSGQQDSGGGQGTDGSRDVGGSHGAGGGGQGSGGGQDSAGQGQLLPVLWSESSPRGGMLEAVPHWPVAGGRLHLALAVVAMTPRGTLGMYHVTHHQLGDQSFNELMAEACENLTADLRVNGHSTDDGQLLSMSGNLVSAMVCLPDFYQRLAELAGATRLIVGLPGPDEVYVAAADSPLAGAIQRMVHESEYPDTELVPCVLAIEGDHIQVLSERGLTEP